ncbi:hypothetical protein AJ80_04759 [Polytolypa hystricis UAMH7299]|uniref:Mitochondrial K+-H+ exchange-related-domain-containing protein n=1 Tax=Polytolypa hystricis (strain UAMH7299) TaxID=1447883 RepID=A0A2B7Y947_POLH7|nr:hypothetical protein AJ80_04759 [Polytolypa hystricis UAMH7299]
MRLFMVPITSKRTLIYCKRIDGHLTKQVSYIDRLTNKASETWAKFEEVESGWKKSLVVYGHRALQRIPYEEWGLKSVPPLGVRREAEELSAHTPVDLIYPANVIKSSRVLDSLRQLATERQDLHRKKMLGSLAAAPLTAPVALIPLIPNIPFFYLLYRGWSHWRALNGSKHLEFLLEKNLVNPIALPELEHLYSKNMNSAQSSSSQPLDYKNEKNSFEVTSHEEDPDDRILLKEYDGKQLAEILGAPELAAEVERAVGQVKHRLKEKRGVKSR